MRSFRLLMSALLLTTSLTGHARWQDFDFDFEGGKSWKEVEATLPPYPKTENLLRFDVSAASDNHFFVDAESISVGEDGVIRYTLMIKSEYGAENVTFEGMRCKTRETKVYAYGRRNSQWSKAWKEEWKTNILRKDVNRHHLVLYDDFFCPNEIPAYSKEEIIDAFKRGRHPNAKSW